MAATAVITPVKSAEDERSYRVVTLTNKLVVTLVSDPTTDKAAAAMDVNVGHFCDPEELPGLAHFLEHMLFLGTEKYPDENSYSAFLSAHGGSSNAFTGMESTNFFFDVTHPHLKEALDRFAQFFIAPLFTESATDREMNAVHNENAKNLLNDMWRQFQFMKSTSDPSHPFSKFGTGNLTTLRDKPKELGVDTRKGLLKFHADYYSANIMKLVIIGRESLDTLQAWAQEMFGKIENRDIKVPRFVGAPFKEPQLKKVYKLVPVKDIRSLGLVWPMPSTNEHYRAKPTSLLAHLIGHEGEGSLLSLLKRKGWVNELMAGVTESTSGFAVFGVRLELSTEGLDHIDDIITIVFQYIALVNTADEKEWKRIFEEERDISAMNFRFKGKENPFSYSSSLAGKMQKYDPEDILAGPWLFKDFNFAIIRKFLSYLTPDNLRVQIVSNTFKGKTDQKEPWYETEYAEEKLSDELYQRMSKVELHKELHLPDPNHFIATEFGLVESKEEQKYPVELQNDQKLRCWFKLDDTFKKPKLGVICEVTSPVAYSSPRNAMLTDLYTRILEDCLAEFSYNATIAGLHYQLYPTSTGLKLSVSGYNHKLPVLMNQIVDRMLELPVKTDRFTLIKEQVIRDLKNFELEQPYQHALYDQAMALEDGRWHFTEKLAAVADLTPEDLKVHAKELVSQLRVEMLVHGNMSKEDASTLANKVKERLVVKPLLPSQAPQVRLVMLPLGKTLISRSKELNPADVNSALYSYWQVGPNDTVKKSVSLQLLAHLVQEPCFDQLRTKEQLGYLVFSGMMVQRGVLGFRVIIQSSDKSADYLYDRAEDFLKSYESTLNEMKSEEFEKNRAAVIAKKLEKDKTLAQETGRHWKEIASSLLAVADPRVLFSIHRYQFDRRDVEVEAMRKLTLEDIQSFFKEFIAQGGAQRRQWSSQVFGKDQALPTVDANTDASDDVCVYTPVDYTSFRRSMPLYPHLI